MSISEIASSTAASTTTSSSSVSSATESYDTFAKLLAAQLQYQDPTDPYDTDEMTNQLVQYSQLEQQFAMNDTLSSILEMLQGVDGEDSEDGVTDVADAGTAYLGNTVTADTATVTAGDDGASWTIEVQSSDGSVTIQVVDADGNVVSSETISADAGTQSYTLGSDTLTSGEDYSLAATDSDGNALAVSVTGEVVAVDVSSGDAVLTLDNGSQISAADVVGIAVA